MKKLAAEHLFPVLIGCAAFLLLFGAKALHPTNLDWLLRDDLTQHVFGWLFFQRGGWVLPLGTFTGVLHPFGSSLAFSDTFPWFAVFFKAVPVIPLGGQITGLWMLTCFVLLSLFSNRLLRTLGVRGMWLLSGTALMTLNPVIIHRFDIGHATLCMHWVVVCALWLSFRSERSYGPWFSLVLISSGLHPYLAATVVALALAAYSPFSLATETKRHVKVDPRALMASVSFLVTALLVFALFGYFGGSALASSGFHFFGADLFGFFNPRDRSALFPGFMKAGQYEGFIWLGPGGIVLLASAYLYLRKKKLGLRAAVRESSARSTILVCVLLFIFSMGSSLRVGGFWIADLELLYLPFDGLTNALRACGRFAWPAFYAVMALSIAGASRYWGQAGRAKGFLALVLLLQVVDQGPYLQSSQRMNPDLNLLTARDVERFQGKIEHVHLVPAKLDLLRCGIESDEDLTPLNDRRYLSGMVAAFYLNATYSSGTHARANLKLFSQKCDEFMQEVVAGRFARDSLYMVEEAYLSWFQVPERAMQCDAVRGVYLCFHKDLLATAHEDVEPSRLGSLVGKSHNTTAAKVRTVRASKS